MLSAHIVKTIVSSKRVLLIFFYTELRFRFSSFSRFLAGLRMYPSHSDAKISAFRFPVTRNRYMFLIAWQANTEQDGTLLRQKYKDAADNKYIYIRGRRKVSLSRRQLHPFGGWEILSDRNIKCQAKSQNFTAH